MSTNNKSKAKRKQNRGKNKHHRHPASKGGKTKDGNIVVVKVIEHRAYHLLHDSRSPLEVAATLNTTWLPLRTVLVPIEVAKLRAVLKSLLSLHEIELDLEELGLTEDHFRYHGSDEERGWYREEDARLKAEEVAKRKAEPRDYKKKRGRKK